MTHPTDHPLSRDGANVPSDLELDRLHLGELDAAEEADVRQRLAADPHGEERMHLRTAGFAAFSNLDPDKMVASIHRRVVAEAAEAESTRRPGLAERFSAWLRTGWGPALVGAAAAVAVVVATGVGDSGPDPGHDTVLTKGSVKLNVYRAKQDAPEGAPVISGDVFAAGDSLSFAVDAPAAGHVMIVGVEPSGATYAAYPLGATDAAATAAGPQTIPGAVALPDSFGGDEWLHLVWCPEPFQLAQVAPKSEVGERSAAGLSLPTKACRSDAFELAAGARR